MPNPILKQAVVIGCRYGRPRRGESGRGPFRKGYWALSHLGSGLIDQSQKATAAAIQIADK